MSSSAIAWAFRQPLRGNAKLLLLTLADCADDWNRTSPHIRRLEHETGLGRHTVIRLLAQLEDEGVVRVERAPGRPCVYILDGAPARIPPAAGGARAPASVRTTSVQNGTGAKLAPVPESDPHQCQIGTPTGATVAPVDPEIGSLRSTSEESRKRTRELDSQREVVLGASRDVAPDGAAPRSVRSVPVIGTRLDANWVLPKSWGEWAVAQGLDAATVRTIAEDFADHWHAAPGQRGRKADWQATWRRWIRREIDNRRPRGAAAELERAKRKSSEGTPTWQTLGFESFEAWQASFFEAPPGAAPPLAAAASSRHP